MLVTFDVPDDEGNSTREIYREGSYILTGHVCRTVHDDEFDLDVVFSREVVCIPYIIDFRDEWCFTGFYDADRVVPFVAPLISLADLN